MPGRERRGRPRAQRGQALLEAALVLPLLLFLAFCVVAAGRVTQAKIGVSAVAREAARAAAQSDNAADAVRAGQMRAADVATGYNLEADHLAVTIDAGSMEPGDTARTVASYEVGFDDLPLLGWAHLRLTSSSQERVDLYRSRWHVQGAP